MKKILYGERPYHVAIVHGGAGAPGSIAPVARELSKAAGVLEPMQTKSTLEGQIEELRDVLEKHRPRRGWPGVQARPPDRRQGNPMKWIDITADEVLYIDPGLTAPIVGMT